MEHNVKLSDKIITIRLQSENECKIADFYFNEIQICELGIEMTINQMKIDCYERKLYTKDTYLRLRAALVDIVAQFYY